MKILFIEPYPTEGPSSRYRVEQYIPYLRSKGIICFVRPFMSSKLYKIIYKKNNYFRKALYFIVSSLNRFLDLFKALEYDIIFIHLEAYPFGPPVFEWLLKKSGKKIIYDLDDAIYLGKTSLANKFLRLLKNRNKIIKIIKMSSHIITCNKFLADYSRKYNKNVSIIHTSVDTDKFLPEPKNNKHDFTIGWIGSHTTAVYLEELKNVFFILGKKYKFIVKIVGAPEYIFKIKNINVINKEWSLEGEIDEFRSLDIGVYPLPDNEWTHGKTGFKTIQYMSMGIPSVVSDVGANKYIVKDGVNGYLAKTEEEWIEKLSRLIEDKNLREKIGSEGRRTVEESYSLKINSLKYLDIIRKVAADRI